MGDYATYQGQRIKTGSTGEQFNLRANQVPLLTVENIDGLRDVRFLESNGKGGVIADQLTYRFPWPDEDSTDPGDYGDAFRTVELRSVPGIDCSCGRDPWSLIGQRPWDGQLQVLIRCVCGSVVRLENAEEAAQLAAAFRDRARAIDMVRADLNAADREHGPEGESTAQTLIDFHNAVADRIEAGYRDPLPWATARPLTADQQLRLDRIIRRFGDQGPFGVDTESAYAVEDGFGDDITALLDRGLIEFVNPWDDFRPVPRENSSRIYVRPVAAVRYLWSSYAGSAWEDADAESELYQAVIQPYWDALSAGTQIRATVTEVPTGQGDAAGSPLFAAAVYEIRDPFTDATRYAVLWEHCPGSETDLHDYADRAQAETDYEKTIRVVHERSGREPHFRYTSTDVTDLPTPKPADDLADDQAPVAQQDGVYSDPAVQRAIREHIAAQPVDVEPHPYRPADGHFPDEGLSCTAMPGDDIECGHPSDAPMHTAPQADDPWHGLPVMPSFTAMADAADRIAAELGGRAGTGDEEDGDQEANAAARQIAAMLRCVTQQESLEPGSLVEQIVRRAQAAEVTR